MLRLLLPLLHTVSAGPPPEPPFGLRIEYLGAAAADPTAPLPPPATPGECAASSVFVGGVASEWKVGSTSVPAAPLALSCPHGRTIEHIEAFFGDPSGSCAAGFTKGQCDSPTAQAVVDALCLHKASCTVPTQYNESHWKGVRFPSPLSSLFLPDPCEGCAKQLAVRATCSGQLTHRHARSMLPPTALPPPPSPVLGVEATRPRLSWKLAASGPRGEMQAAYEIRVVEHFNTSSVLWESGKVVSPNRTQVIYGGSAALAPLGAYSWSVRWWGSSNSEPSEFSAQQRFDMAPLAESWAAVQYVGGGNQLRTELELPSLPVSATLCVAGLGLAHPYVNGVRVSDHALGPQSQLLSRVLYTSYDITPLIKAGANALGLMLGSGKYGYLNAWCTASSAVECLAARVLLHVRYASGATEFVNLPTSAWSAREGPVRSSDYYYGEFYDARREHPGWASANFTRKLGWSSAVEMTPNVSKTMSSALIQPIRPSERFEAKSIKVLNKPSDSGQFPAYGHPEKMGIAIYDFGQNVAGFCILRLPSCVKGNLIRLRYAETTWPGDERIYNQFQSCSHVGSQCAFQEDTYICRGDGKEEVFTPSETYHGFRWVEVTGWGGSFDNKMLTSYLVHTNVAEVSSTRFDSYDPHQRNIINDIKHITLYAQKSNVHSIPTDCPTRERRGWMGDAWVSSDGGMLTLDTGALHTKWVRDIYDEQGRNPAGPNHGCAPNIAPAECPGGADEFGQCPGGCGAPPWAIAAIVIPYNMWRYHGDTQILSTYYSRMVMFMEWLQSKADNATGLVTHDGLADWCPPASTDTEPAQVSSFSQLMGYGMMAEVAEALGKNDDVARATAMLTRLKLAYNTRYYDANTSLYQDSAPHGGFIKANVQTSNSMALYLGVPATQTQTKQVVASLVHDIVERSHHLSTGIIGTRTLLDTLSMFNQTEVSYKLAVQETYPGHGHFVRQNATTLWERWEATTHDPTGGSSMNHIMYGGQQSFYFTSLIGLRMAEGVRGAGWGSIVVAPHVPTGLAGAALRLDTDRGEITVQWSQGNATAKPATTLFALSVTVPVGTNASLCIPTFDKGLKQVAMSESGNPLFHEGNFVAVAGCTSAAPSALGSICFECGSGSYEIELAH